VKLPGTWNPELLNFGAFGPDISKITQNEEIRIKMEVTGTMNFENKPRFNTKIKFRCIKE
jgi:hypothetical protein